MINDEPTDQLRTRLLQAFRDTWPVSRNFMDKAEPLVSEFKAEVALAARRQTLLAQGICPDCFSQLMTPMGRQDVDWPRLLNAHRCESKEPR